MPLHSNTPDSPLWDQPLWFAVRCQTRREHLAAATLSQLENVQALCPKIRFLKATKRGKIWFEEALFPGYLFAHFCRKDHERNVKYARGVRGLVHFNGHHPPIPDSFIQQLQQKLEANGGNTLIIQPKIEVGNQVEIASGAFSGESGSVVEILPGGQRVLLLVEWLGKPQTINVDLYSLILPRDLSDLEP